jgi:hypothetical protein
MAIAAARKIHPKNNDHCSPSGLFDVRLDRRPRLGSVGVVVLICSAEFKQSSILVFAFVGASAALKHE